MRTPVERYQTDPVFHHLVQVYVREFQKADSTGAGLTPTEIREASSLAWQLYLERHALPAMILREEA